LKLYAEQLILSYLELLVNSRNELSLATVINVPDRDIDHQSFTHIKHEAAKRNLSIYQTILSFITRIRLGGKSYAPPSDNPLTNHIKGLSEFVDVLNKLHSILEE
ncbi:hypothetical protein HELRODRAFT_135220, partial [Helobdella robusta]|uniref:PCNA-interacting partner n=1 Tax=Helobdella robusta TaxID=6412 RepID=T1EI76_HELRO